MDSKRKRLKGPRKKAALVVWRRFGWTGLQLSPGSALSELAYLAGKDHDISLRLLLMSLNRVVVLSKRNNNYRALACRLESRGVSHVIASRTPRQGQLSLEEGLREALVILAVPAHVVHTLPLENLPKDSVVVDCSNRERKCGEDEVSQAEHLAAGLPPGPVVVKALNTVSGYFLEQVTEQSVKPVPIASDSTSAKVTIWAKSRLKSQTLIMINYLGHGCLLMIVSSY